MKQKKIALMGVAAVAALGLVSCGGSSSKTSKTQRTQIITSLEQDTKGLDIYVNYQGKQGITLQQKDSYVNKADGITYSKGDLLPTWKEFQTATKTTFRDATKYATTSDATTATAVDANGYKSETDSNQLIDLYYQTTSEINKIGKAGKAKDLTQYLDIMPNFKAFLEANPTIKKQITQSGKIYYTPYFDGYNAVERMHIMDVNLAKKVLDNNPSFDTEKTNGGNNPSANVIQGKGLITPFIDAQYNYPKNNQEISVSVNGEAKSIKVKQVKNIVLQQNELLAAGCTGKQLGEQLVKYLNDAYGHEVGAGKTFATLSDIFVSESAAYNTDELIALMRVVKANPKLISGNASEEIEILVPRAAANNRVQNMMHMLNIFGIQGMDTEKEGLFFDANGKINDAYALESTYEGLQFLSAMYDEGLILGDFYAKVSTNYVGKYFGKTTDDASYGFMLYDFSATQAQMNTRDEDGIGTKDSARKGAFKDTSVTGVMPVLPPVTWWATGKDWKYSQSLSDHTGMSLMRRSTSNRTLKTNAWCIPATSDNPERAAILMDHLFSKEGQLTQDFGPRSTNYWKTVNDSEFMIYNGMQTPEFSDAVKTMISDAANEGTDFWTFMRAYLGSTHGIGHVRTAGINYLATNKYGKIGTKNIENAIADGVVCLDMVDKNGVGVYGYDNSVPSAGYGSESSADDYAAVTAFWAQDKNADSANGWVAIVVNPVGSITKTSTTAIGKDSTQSKVEYSYSKVYQQLNARIKKYLYDLVSGYDEDLVPAYVLETK
jgi:putative aldouronate transport system substrate-binding protein